MAEFILEAEPVLGGYDRDHSGTRLKEVVDLALVSMAVPMNDAGKLKAALDDAYGVAFPAPGKAVWAQDGLTRLVWLGPDFAMLILPRTEGLAVEAVSARLGVAAYYTEQTDAWVALRLSGSAARPALERLCPLDLDAESFPPGSAGRTVMEHLGTLVLCEAADEYLLLSASSSARSFLHALETALPSVSGAAAGDRS